MKRTILVVDDARVMRNIIKSNLKDNDEFELFEATNGQEAVKQYDEIKPDLVTMDITMDVQNGVEAAREILSHDPDARIIMVTALGQEKLLSECIEMGVKDYILKPFSKDRIISAISKALNGGSAK
ncbi:response regulator [bacterium]|nr:response regulator [bacterium]